VPEHLRTCTDEELMVQAEATISALQVEYERAQQLCLDRLAAAESLAAHMERTCVHISRVSERLSRFRQESGRHLAHPYGLPKSKCLTSISAGGGVLTMFYRQEKCCCLAQSWKSRRTFQLHRSKSWFTGI